MDEKIVLEENEVIKENFLKKHTKGIKRGLAVVGGLAGLVVAGALINNKRSNDEGFVCYEKNDQFTDSEETNSED